LARPSLIYQVNTALNTINRVGQKKNKKNKRLVKESIFHGKTFKVYQGHAIVFVKWAKERYGIKWLLDITPEIGKAYIQYLIDNKYSPYSIQSIRSALKKLEIGIKKAYHHSVKIIPQDTPKIPIRKLSERQGRGAFTDFQVADIQVFVEEIDPQAAKALDVQLQFGLRISELLGLRCCDILFPQQKLVVWRGKGGRLREVPFPDSNAAKLLHYICYGKKDKDLLFLEITEGRLRGTLQKACEMAGIKNSKTHNLRHTYVVKEYKKLTGIGFDDIEARKKLTQNVGHNRVDVTYAYAPRNLKYQIGKND